MLALRFSIHIKIKLKGKCPKHPRFNPEIGQGAIRGGCRECLALYQVVAGRDQAATALRQFEEIAERYECSQDHALDEAKVGIETWWRATRGIHKQPNKN